MSEPENLPQCPKCGEAGIPDKRTKDGKIRYACSHCQEVWTLPENWQEPCKHNNLTATVQDFGIFEQRTNQYVLEGGEYLEDDEWTSWQTKSGDSEKAVGDIQCNDCEEYFFEDGNMLIEEDHPMYSKVNNLVEFLRSGF